MSRGWKHALFLACLLLLLTYLFNESRDPDRPSRLHLQDALRTLELHDAELSRDVLMARAGQLASYDALMQDRQSLLEDLATLKQTTEKSSPAAAAVVQRHLSDVETAVKEKLGAVERFKSDNALARNSLMYLTYPAGFVDSDDPVSRIRPVESAHLQNTLLRFVETLDNDVVNDIKAELARLTQPTAGTSPPSMVAHGRLIVDVLPRVDTLLRRVVSASTTMRARELDEALRDYATQVEARAQLFRYAVYFFSLILFGYLIHQFVLLGSTATNLRASNTRLELEMAERAQAEIEVRNNEQRYRAITEFANEAIISIDSNGRIVSWNVGAVAIFGHRADLMLNKTLDSLIPKRLFDARAKGFQSWQQSGPTSVGGTTVETAGLRRDGSEFPLEMSRSTWTTSQGNFETVVIRDISLRKALEATTRQQELQLIHANKMTALGTLVLGVAHEVNNPNQAVVTNAGILATTWADAVEVLDIHAKDHGRFNLGGLPYEEMRISVQTSIAAIREAAQRIDRFVNSLKDYSRPRDAAQSHAFQLNVAVARSMNLLNYLINQRTTHLRIDLAQDLPLVQGDIHQIEQVFVNLLVNSLEALPDRTHGVQVSTRFDVERQKVVLQVRDQGQGIAPEKLPHICDPFFTTKHDSGGTGLGLAISAAMIRAHKGLLEFSSALGKGTCATVMLDPSKSQKLAST